MEKVEDSAEVRVIVINNAVYPAKPVKHTFTFKPQDFATSLRERIVKETGYKADKFDLIGLNNTPFAPAEGKTFQEIGISKTMLYLNKKQDASKEDFPVLEMSRLNISEPNIAKHENKEQISSSKTEKESKGSSRECGICLTEVDELESLGCKHNFCKGCLAKQLSNEFDEKRKSFLDLFCPGSKCLQKFSEETIRKYASEKTLANYLSILKTIPKNPKDPSLKLSDFCYTYDSKGMLVHMDTGDKFHWVNQIHYDLLGDLIAPYIQEQMVQKLGMKEVFLPAKPNPAHVRTNIFLTPDALSNPNKLMLLIQGSGAVRAGQWARALCINDSLSQGSIVPYLEKAMAAGYGVIVFNPNLNKVPKDLASALPKYEDFFLPGKPKLPEVPLVSIPEHDNPLAHTITVWDQFAANAAAAEIVIVAHSAGGHCTMGLLRNREKQVLSRLKAIAFTDSVHSASPRDPKDVQQFLSKHAINWVQSDKPLDTPMGNSEGCKCVSAGHPKHEYTSPSAIESVFKFLSSKVTK